MENLDFSCLGKNYFCLRYLFVGLALLLHLLIIHILNEIYLPLSLGRVFFNTLWYIHPYLPIIHGSFRVIYAYFSIYLPRYEGIKGFCEKKRTYMIIRWICYISLWVFLNNNTIFCHSLKISVYIYGYTLFRLLLFLKNSREVLFKPRNYFSSIFYRRPYRFLSRELYSNSLESADE